MGYNTYADSRDQGAPIELYLFRYGPGADDVFAYTNSERPVSIVHEVGGAATVYTPTAISRGDITESGGMDKKDLSVEAPANSEIADMFKGWPPSQVVSLTVYEGEIDDSSKELAVVWNGRVLGSTISGTVSTLRCESAYTGMQRTGLKRHYQYGCPHQLYGPMCKADKAAATRSTTVSSISGAEISLPVGWNGAFAAAKFANGFASWTRSDGRKELLAILKSVDADTLLLAARPRDLVAGQAIDLILGCDHTLTDCTSLHGNTPNFGGCPYIPTENPVGIKNNFY